MRQTRCNTLGKIYEYKDEIDKLNGKFSDLLRRPVNLQTIITFPNGYGISFVEHSFSYGLEAAIIKYRDEDDWDLCYDSGITDDVIGYMGEDDIVPLCEKVSKLQEWRI